MSRIFNRIITFHVRGEIYNSYTSPEEIINNYDWTFDDNYDGNVQIFAHHNDDRGKITDLIKLPKIHQWKTSDTEFFLNQ
jgi:hypothetical protein